MITRTDLLLQSGLEPGISRFIASLLRDIQSPVVLYGGSRPIPGTLPPIPHPSCPPPAEPLTDGPLDRHGCPLPCQGPPTLYNMHHKTVLKINAYEHFIELNP